MHLESNTLKKCFCTLSLGIMLLIGMSVSTQAQHRHGPPPWAPAYGRRNDRPYGQIVRARVHARNDARRDLILSQRLERRSLRDRLRYERRINGNSPDWRYQRRQERQNLILNQRNQRQVFRDSWKNNGRGRH